MRFSWSLSVRSRLFYRIDRYRDRFLGAGCPDKGVKQQLLSLWHSHLIETTKRGIKDPFTALFVYPSDRVDGFLIWIAGRSEESQPPDLNQVLVEFISNRRKIPSLKPFNMG